MNNERLTNDQLAMMAAIMGVSNSGSDQLFHGPHPDFTPKMVGDYFRRAVGSRWGISTDGATHWLVESLCETEEMLENFQGESRSWVSRLRRMTVERFKTTWPRYAPFLEALQ